MLRALADPRPLLFLSRHAGPADTLLLLDLLMTRYGRMPSVVFKQTLAIDPVVDVIGHRLPHAVIDTSDPEECVTRIQAVSGELAARRGDRAVSRRRQHHRRPAPAGAAKSCGAKAAGARRARASG